MASARWQAAGHALGTVAFDQALQTQACPIAMLRMRTCVQDRFDQLGHCWSDAAAPRHQPRGRPLQVGSVRRRHVLWLGDEPPPTVLAHVAGDPPTAMEDLDHLRGGAHLDRFSRQPIRHRVEARVELDVVIDVDFGRFPQRELVACGWQRLKRTPFELLEQRASRDGLAAERAAH